MAERPRVRAAVGRDRGTATAELAVALPAVALTAAVIAGAAQVAVAQIACVDAARAGARAAARGDTPSRVQEVAQSAAREGGEPVIVTTTVARAGVVVRVRRAVHVLLPRGPAVTVTGAATAEPEQPAELGSATVLAAVVAAMAAALAMAIVLVGGALVARHRALAAADLAALAAASALRDGPRQACAAAGRVAAANDAGLAACRPEATGQAVDVVVSVRPPGVLGRWGSASARARAGQGWR